MNIIVRRDTQDNLNYHFYYKRNQGTIENYAFTIFRDLLWDILESTEIMDTLDNQIKRDGYAEAKLTMI